jgi:hypothetical protein
VIVDTATREIHTNVVSVELALANENTDSRSTQTPRCAVADLWEIPEVEVVDDDGVKLNGCKVSVKA